MSVTDLLDMVSLCEEKALRTLRWARTLIIVICVSLAFATSTRPALAEQSPNPAVSAWSQSDSLLSNQRILLSFKSWIMNLPEISNSGYIESVNDAANMATALLWYGSSPLQELIMGVGAKQGITVKITPRQYGIDQIDAGVVAVLQTLRLPQYKAFRVSYVAGVVADYDGITVRGAYSETPSATTSLETLTSATTAAASMPTRILLGDVAVPAVATRSNDFAPLNAGGYIRSPSTGGTCSSGFSITLSGVRRTTTARHCTANDYRARDGSASYGTSIRISDAGARVLSTSGSPLMFDGAWNNSTGYKKVVDGLSDPGINDLVCTSGGNSGVHCNIKIDSMRVMFNDGFGEFSNIHATQQSSNAIAVIQGDSGGPVFTLSSPGHVFASGMIQGVDQLVSNCGSVHDPGGLCGRGVLFSSTRTILRSMPGSGLVTG